jgi:hypothetical protein
MKVLFGMALRQTTGFVKSLLRLVCLNWAVPDFSTLSRRQKTLAVNIPYCGSNFPLHLLIDSTGIKIEGEGEWSARKHGASKRRIWRKIHLGIDEETLEFQAVEITKSHFGNAPILPDLLSQIPTEEEIGSVTADGAYDTQNVTTPSRTEVRMPSSPRARTPSRGNYRPQVQLRAMRRSAREIPRSRHLTKLERIPPPKPHRNETKMHCMKLLGQRLMVRDFERQVVGIQVRIAVLNHYTVLGIHVTKVSFGERGSPRSNAFVQQSHIS